MKNVYEKYTKMCTKFGPYLVWNSLHFCSVFQCENMVLKVRYFEDRPQNRRWKVQYFEDRPHNRRLIVHYFEDNPQIAICTVYQFEDRPQTNTQCSMRINNNDDATNIQMVC